MSHDVEKTPAIGISYQVGISETRQVVFQCFVPMDCEAAELNGTLDKLRVAADRQEATVLLPQKRARLAAFRKGHDRSLEDIERIDAQRREAAELRRTNNAGRRTDKLSAQETAQEGKAQADRANALVTVQRHESEIAALEAEIADLEQKVN